MSIPLQRSEKKALQMTKRLVFMMAGLAMSAMALVGCSTTVPAASHSTPPATSNAAPAPVHVDLATATTSLGTVVVDGKGRTVYLFTKDTANAGTSACSGQCATVWPAVITTSATPSVTGVTGTVSTIALADGAKQVTLDGWPLYTFASDTSAGKVDGQGVQGIWWAVSPAGSRITTTGATPSDDSTGGGSDDGW
jgi:predicted lipoprotein with Yx(FWY)xxD motif